MTHECYSEPRRQLQLHQDKARPIIEALHARTAAEAPEGCAIAKALDYSLKRWAALVRYLDDGNLPIDNTRSAPGPSNWLFAGSLRSGRRDAALMTLIQSARLIGHDPDAYLKGVLTRLPTQKASALAELLPHTWTPTGKVGCPPAYAEGNGKEVRSDSLPSPERDGGNPFPDSPRSTASRCLTERYLALIA